MAVLHACGRERGHIMQATAGIPCFYRRFGYEMAIWMGSGRRLFARELPVKPSDEPPSDATSGEDRLFRLRPATVSDAPFRPALPARLSARCGQLALRRSRPRPRKRRVRAGKDPGAPRDLSAGTLRVYAYELADGVSWLEANPFLLNTLAQAGEQRPDSLTFSLGQSHPFYEAFSDPPLYDLDRDGHYSFYVRVPDLPAFLLQVAPVLEERLSRDPARPHKERGALEPDPRKLLRRRIP